MGKHDTRHLINALDRLDENLDVQWGRVGLMERWLENHTRRLNDLSSRIDESLARIDALLARSKVTT